MVERPARRLAGSGRGRGGRLADFHVDDMAARRLDARRPLHHVHDDEGGDLAAAGSAGKIGSGKTGGDKIGGGLDTG
ncbi:hypothetical protein GCM10017643_29600 [Ancylobacter dichloromethanicus]|uniref:Uncharacterized protein n=1 Tax=Ancylobacter dichloromethanicus TaxID=518825 RepID=A0A9W6JBR0_9HYPH|nr:hypothetical protein GCM10017643_29600 [Ancylobacter dichloromethanicus]